MVTDMHYTVKQLAGLAGVSARTLHYYDEIGLLKPSRNPHNGYRIYGRAALLRLQQILFLRELGMSLEEIQMALDRPDFDLVSALERHREALLASQERLSQLLQTVDRTILYLKGSIEMEGEELFAGFSEEKQKEYEKVVQVRYGEQPLKESQRRWSSYSAPQKQKIRDEGNALYRDLVAAIPYGPASPEAQAGIARWHEHMRYFYEPTPQILLGLADMYNEDPDFAATFQRIHPELAAFMRQAIQHYCRQAG